MKTVIATSKTDCIHVETELGIINIRPNLHNITGQRVVSVEVLVNKYAGEKAVFLRGNVNTRLVEAAKKRN